MKDKWKGDQLGSAAVQPETVATSDHSDKGECRA